MGGFKFITACPLGGSKEYVLPVMSYLKLACLETGAERQLVSATVTRKEKENEEPDFICLCRRVSWRAEFQRLSASLLPIDVLKNWNDVKNGMKIGVISMSCSWAVKVGKIMNDNEINYLIYTSQTSEDKFDNLVDDWSNEKVRVIIYSPSISSGVSFDDEMFDKIYAYGINVLQGPSVDDFKQMLFRIRKLKMGEIHLYFDIYL